MAAITICNLEEAQNSKNKMAALRCSFFSRKIHKLKKMLQPLFARKPRQPEPMVQIGTSAEDLQNAMNEALENRLAEDLASSNVTGDAIQAIVDGQVTLVVVNAASTPVPPSFFSTTPGRFSWTFMPSADNDICPRGDVFALSSCQTPEQQTPPPSPL